MPQERTEGTTTFTTESEDRITAGMPVFYNPVMKLNRDLTLLMLAAMPSWMTVPVRVALPMEASGIRAARILAELPPLFVPARLSVNDRSAIALSFARMNCDRHRGAYPEDQIAFSTRDASVFLQELGGAEYVDIDPFGTPNPFLDAAVRAVTRGGIIAVTATDTSALAGTYPRATRRKYWATPSRTWAMHEWGLRILIRKIQLVAAQHERALVPVVSVVTDHYYRIFLRNEGSSATRIQELLAQHQFLALNTQTQGVTVATDTATAFGPLWTGPLHDPTVVAAMRAAAERLDATIFSDATALLSRIADEARFTALGFYDLHELAASLHIPCPKRDAVLERLGDRAGRTHVCAYGIRTTATPDEVAGALRAAAAEALQK